MCMVCSLHAAYLGLEGSNYTAKQHKHTGEILTGEIKINLPRDKQTLVPPDGMT